MRLRYVPDEHRDQRRRSVVELQGYDLLRKLVALDALCDLSQLLQLRDGFFESLQRNINIELVDLSLLPIEGSAACRRRQ